MSTRNRELLFLFPALLLTTLGFALVYTQKSADPHLVVAHLRRRSSWCCSPSPTSAAGSLAPEADPYLLPVTALLSTLGILVLYRIERGAGPAAGHVAGGGPGRLPARAGVRARPQACCADYRTSSASPGCCCCSSPPCFGREINGARLWVGLRADPLPAGGVRQDLARRLLRRLPGATSARCSP